MSLKRRWNNACAETFGSEVFWRIAVDHRSILRSLRPLIARHARGVVLDAGAGALAWRSELSPHAERYVATDFSPTHPDLAFCADLRRLPLEPGSIDTIFCCSVLEHVEEPWLVLPEFRRVLKPNGRIILSVPFLYHLHDPPRDYFRFSTHGIAALAEAAGLEVLEREEAGGLAHTICNSLSIAIVAMVWTKRAPFLATTPAALLHGLARAIDSLDGGHIFAQTVNLVLRPRA